MYHNNFFFSSFFFLLPFPSPPGRSRGKKKEQRWGEGEGGWHMEINHRGKQTTSNKQKQLLQFTDYKLDDDDDAGRV